MSQRYDGRVAWITGGASGFGAGAARRLAGLGAQGVLSDVYDDNAAAVARVLDLHGRLDIAFLNAGIATGLGIGDDFDLDRYRRAMGVNLDGVAFGLHHCLAAMKGR